MARVTAPKGLTVTDHLSYSQISQLSSRYKYSCARKWAYERIAGVPTYSGMPLICGSAFDAGANTYFESIMRGAPWDEALDFAKEEAGSVFDTLLLTENLRENPGAKSGQYKESMLIALHHFGVLSKDVKVGLTQQRHEFTVRASDGYVRTILGFSDRIDTDGCIVDHKYTGSPKVDSQGNWDMEWVGEKRDQLVVYWLSRMAEYQRALASGEAWNQPPVEPQGKLVVVCMRSNSKTPTIKEYKMEFDNSDRDRVLSIISESDRTARSGRYPMRPGDACQFCSALERCRSDAAKVEPLFKEFA